MYHLRKKSTQYRRSAIRVLFVTLLAMMSALNPESLYAQCGFQAGEGCAGTDYNNYGFASTNNFQTLEYDNYISSFHSTIVRTYDGSFLIWGEGVASNGVQNSTGALTVPTAITPANGYTYGTNNKILKAALASSTVNQPQAIILTQNGLYTWGYEGAALHADLTSSTAFQAIASGAGNNSIINGNTWDLPGTIQPQQVKMLFATDGTLAIVTCDGQAWVLSQNANVRHNIAGTTTVAGRTWVRVSTATNTVLENVIALRGVDRAMIALTYNSATQTQGLYTWGQATRTGSGNAADNGFAAAMTKPGTGNIKMIGATQAGTNITYYVLNTSGALYALGDNAYRQLGNWNGTTNSNSWVQPTYTSGGTAMNDIKWISPSEHDGIGWGAVNVINNAGQIWNWGTDIGVMLGRSSTPTSTEHDGTSAPEGKTVNPGQPADTKGVGGPYTSVETGGHTTMATRQCVANFGYVGHAIRGSAGDNKPATQDQYYRTFEYNTEGVQVCGATTDAVITIESSVSATGLKYCSNMQSLTLVGTPAGGTFSLVTPVTGVSLVGNTLTLSGITGAVKVRYNVSSVPPCNLPLEKDLIIDVEPCTYKNVSGKVWNDTDRDAVLDGGEPGVNPGTGGGTLYANLVFTDAINGDKIAASVKVNADGTYNLPATYGPGTYRVEITNKSFGANTPASSINNTLDRTLPGNWSYTGTNVNNANACAIPCTTPYTIAGITVGSSNVSGYNFGVQLPTVAISGNVWHDNNGNAQINGGEKPVSGYNADNNNAASSVTGLDLWANLVDQTGKVVSSVHVGKDGTYGFTGVTADASYKVILTTATQTTGADLKDENAATIAGWLATGTNDPTNGVQTGNKTNVINLGTVTANVVNVNFGLQQPPVAEDKSYSVTQSAFTSGAPTGSYAGFPDLPGYKHIPTSSTALTGYSTGGSLSGSDAEDCMATSSCNIGSVFNIHSIRSNTKMYYDFGISNGGIKAIDVTAGPVKIDNFDASKLLIYGQIGQGAVGNEIAFTYSITDGANTTSVPASYTITTSTPLPVTLVSFDLSWENTTVRLYWTTATELNSQGFEIQRSHNARQWSVLDFVDSKTTNGNSNTRLDYSFVDPNPLAASSYYRLKQLDSDGTYAYSTIRAISSSKDFAPIFTYPNPAKTQLTIAGLSGLEVIKVYDTAGKLMMEVQNAPGVAKKIVPIDSLNEGIYIVDVVSVEGVSVSQKIIKTR